jgi:predicted kinase
MLLNGIEEFMRHASKNTALGMSVDGTIQTYNGKTDNKLYVDIESFFEYSDGEIKSYDIIEGYLAAEANRIVRFQQNIDKFKDYAGYNREVKRKDKKGTTVMAGQALTAFDDILTETTQEKLYNLLDEASKNKSGIFNLIDALDENYKLRELIRNDVSKYFTEDTNENLNRLQEAKYVDQGLIDRLKNSNPELTNEDIERTLIKAYTYNSFMHKMETVTLAYGDLVQYNHAKEEFHKRNAGLSSGGKGFRADRRAQIYLSSLKKYYADRMGFESRNYDGTLRTAIMKEMVMPSKMYEEYKEVIYDSVYKRTKNKKIAKTIADKATEEYLKMKIADGQGWITIEAYRQLKEAESNWSDNQERLYRKISKGEELTIEETVEFFPSYKLQYFGNIESIGLPVNSFHKFSLAPIIPGVAKKGTPLYDLHQKMMKDQIDYVLMESGSKVSHIGTGDVVLNEDGTFNKDSEFTVNTIYAEFLKNQTEVNSEYKGKTIFSTQLRKMILEGLYERGVIKSVKYKEITNERVKRYIDHVEEYTDLLKLELLEEMGYEETSPGEYKAKDKSSIGKLLNMIRTNLEREDVLSDDLIEFIDVFDNTGEIIHDLSFHPEAAKIEKLILSMINKRIIKQKVAGEPLVQVSVGMFKNQINNPQFKNATKDEIAKWASATYELPAYHRKSNGYTAACKVMIAMQGTYYNLFNLEYENGENVGVYDADPIYDMAFSELKSTKGDTKLFILESELTPEIKSNLILDDKEGKRIKGGTYQGIEILGDYYSHATLKSKDGDNLDIIVVKNKKDAERQYNAYIKGKAKQFTGIGAVTFPSKNLNIDKSLERLNEKIKDDSWLDANNGANRRAITLVGVRIPVQGLNSMEFAEVFEFLPPQAGNLIIPSAEIVAKSGGDFDIDKLTIFMNTLNEDGTVVKRLGDDLQFIRDLRGTDEFFNTVKIQKAALENELINDIKEILELPDNYASLIMPNGTFILKGIADRLAQYVSKYNPKKNKMTKETDQISPTRVLEALYNIYKHESNIVGKKTLGLGAIENTFNVIMNAIGAYMPDTYKTVKGEERISNMRLRHNVMTDKNGNDVISISDMYDVDGINKIADVISQMINGWVDVEKDAWVFFIQGNYEVAPTLLYLIKSGVPVKEAIYFVSNPLVRDYVNEQRLAKSTYAEVLGKKPKSPILAKYKAAGDVIKKYFTKNELDHLSKNQDRYKKSKQLNDKYFLNKTKKYFTESEMLTLIQENDSKSDMAKAMFLHYLELEQQIGGYTALKMSSNPDTSTKSTISDVEQTEANLSDLQYDSRVPLEIVNRMKTDSILKSFFNGPLALAISNPLFKIRFHKEITNYLIGKKETIRKDLDYVFPGQNIEFFSNIFRNDIISYILQNAIRKYDNKDGFLSLNLETKIPTKLTKYLNRGAFVKDGVLYMDMKQLKKEFRKNAWEKNSDIKNSYEERGLYPLHPLTFRNNSETNFNEYLKFVSQREYLRSLNPLTKDYAKTKSFQEELKNTKELLPDLTQEKAVRYTYEKLIAVEALDNSFNLFHLFESDENAFAIRFINMVNQNPDLAKTYSVLNKLKLDGGKEKGVYNIYLADKDFDNNKSNIYTDDLKKLSDPGYAKVKDPVENVRISNMFKYLNLYAFLQTGLNKTKLNFTNVVGYTDFLSILENESKDFISALEKNGQEVLDDFYTMFTRQNNPNNLNRKSYKDYISDIEFKTVKKAKTTKQTSEVEEGVSELFESNSEIANAVYSALEFTGTKSVSKLDALKKYLKEEDYRLKTPAPSWITDPTTTVGKMLEQIDTPIVKDTIAFLRQQNKKIQELKTNANLITNELYKQAGIDPVKLLEDESTQIENIQRVQKGEKRLPTLELDKLNDLKTSNRNLYEQIEDLGDKQAKLIRESSNVFEKEVKKFFNSLIEYDQKEIGTTITLEQKQKAQQLYSQYLDTKQPNVILPIGTSGSGKSTFIKSLPKENLVVIEPDAMRVEFTGDINNKSKDKEIYIEAANRAVQAIKQGKQVVFDTTNLTKDKRLPFIEAIKKAIPTVNIQYKLMELNPELAKQRIKTQIARGENRANVPDSTIDRHAESYKQMLEDIKNEPITEYKELGSKQDIEGFKEFVGKPAQPASEVEGNVISAKFTGQGTSFELEIQGDNKPFLLVWNRNRLTPSLWGKKQKDGSYTTTDAFPSKQDVQKLVDKYVPKNLLNLLNEWTAASKLPVGKVLDAQAEIEKRIEAELNKPIQQTSEVEDTGVELDSTNMDTEVEEKRIGVKLTDESNVYTYNDKNAKNSYYYSNITKNNNDIVFLHNTSVFEIRPEQIENNTILGGSSYFMTEAPNMSINFPTDLYSHVQNGKKVELPSSQYDLLKSIWERRIDVVKKIQEKNGKIAFPEYGFGNKKTMPEELFVYLSKRLFEEFQYINPGSTMYDQVTELIGKTQGITDEEILVQLELEEDPFKCN